MLALLQTLRWQRTYLVLFGLLIFLGRQQVNGLSNYDDAYYAVKSQGMLTTDNPWVVDYGDGVRYDNPPLHFWITSIGYRIFGESYLTSVLPSALFATGTLLLTHLFALRLGLPPLAAFLSALILLTPGFFQDYARRGMLDHTLVFFSTLALYATWRGRERPWWFVVFGLAAGCAMLTKSVIGGFCVAISWLFLALSPARRRLLHPWWWAGNALWAGLIGTWILQNYRHGGREFFDVHFGWLLVSRAARDSSTEGWGYLLGYAEMISENFWPWLPFLLIGLYAAARKVFAERDQPSLLLLLWIGLIVGVMSAARTQYLRYVLAAFPAMAILSAGTIARLADRRGWTPRIAGGVAALAVVFALLVNVTALELPNAVGLRKNSTSVVAMADFLERNVPEGTQIVNFGLAAWVPRNAVFFHSGRNVSDPVLEEGELLDMLAEDPARLVLTNEKGWRRLQEAAAGSLSEVYRSGAWVVVTSTRHAAEVRYY